MNPSATFRADIEGLRGIAVLAVIFFHLDALPNGYLGVDVFFVISGFLITSLIRREITERKFALTDFYIRRMRRILPLSLVVASFALALGSMVMLPDDLENLAHSVIASNFLANNILQILTTKNYWDVVNEYKPLMHTWSLAVEEQYYLAFPVLLLTAHRFRAGAPVILVAGAAVLSLAAFALFPTSHHHKFYLLFFRFWELAIGGIAALVTSKRGVGSMLPTLALFALAALLVWPFGKLKGDWPVVATVLLSSVLMLRGPVVAIPALRILTSPVLVLVGQLSFSLYMWHQVVIAFARYLWRHDFEVPHVMLLLAITCLLSGVTYWGVEAPFRNPRRTGVQVVLGFCGILLIGSTSCAFYLHSKSGVLRDVPELGLSRSSASLGLHPKYNERIKELDRPFDSSNKTRVLVVGDSFARDWANIILESPLAEKLEVSFASSPDAVSDFSERARIADVIFYSRLERGSQQAAGLPMEKLWVVGSKSFGTSNGIFYNYRGPDYFGQRTVLEKGIWEQNERLKKDWGSRYVDILGKLVDKNRTVPVFTPDDMFISQDCRHLTQAGARFLGELFSQDLEAILEGGSRR